MVDLIHLQEALLPAHTHTHTHTRARRERGAGVSEGEWLSAGKVHAREKLSACV